MAAFQKPHCTICKGIGGYLCSIYRDNPFYEELQKVERRPIQKVHFKCLSDFIVKLKQRPNGRKLYDIVHLPLPRDIERLINGKDF